MTNFFPFTEISYWTGHYVAKPEDFMATWLKERPKNLTWYAFDVIVRSKTEIEFIVYDILCTVRGGIGEEITRVPVIVDESVTSKAIYRRAVNFAEDRRIEELSRLENAIIDSYTKEILESLDG